MNTYQAISREGRLVLVGLTTIAAVGAVLAGPSAATADQATPAGDGGGRCGVSVLAGGIDDQILYRRLQVARDRVERPWAYR
jgi:hypothetical protein